ncbi:hypothetical protein Q7378_10245 [Glaesserella parasuis]|nr:hypothetical protein [Glaesserella parasuis]MDG6260016.1 hypothetical protein [Glaesserella parasuis]MDG6297757.1 hypothetical protein [Glaesserella parasuis]MDG6372881.1 hypothetical protein [Glaesserella parasuis]MDG6478960.1 hypothetical protein [Glaesserella parasuis]MDO9676982.1 hypothetical protein [Glaesserella parasuis]
MLEYIPNNLVKIQSMPLYENAKALIRQNLTEISQGKKAKLQVIGSFTDKQFLDINQHRKKAELPPLECNEIVYIGRHHYQSRSKDGYNINDMVKQAESALSVHSCLVPSNRATALENPHQRHDGYGNLVNDRAILELTSKKPRAELFSVIPKGDSIKPNDDQ